MDGTRNSGQGPQVFSKAGLWEGPMEVSGDPGRCLPLSSHLHPVPGADTEPQRLLVGKEARKVSEGINGAWGQARFLGGRAGRRKEE